MFSLNQYIFRAGHSTIDMIFTLRQVQERSREQCRSLFTVFVDLAMAFDTVSRPILFKHQNILIVHRGFSNFFFPPPWRYESHGIAVCGLMILCPILMSSRVELNEVVLGHTFFGIVFGVLFSYGFRSSLGDIYVRSHKIRWLSLQSVCPKPRQN